MLAAVAQGTHEQVRFAVVGSVLRMPVSEYSRIRKLTIPM